MRYVWLLERYTQGGCALHSEQAGLQFHAILSPGLVSARKSLNTPFPGPIIVATKSHSGEQLSGASV